LIALFSSTGVVFSVVGWSLCQFVLVTLPPDTVTLLEGTVGFGMFLREGTLEEWQSWADDDSFSSLYCVEYSNSEKSDLWDAAWKSGFAMAIISTVIASIAAIAAFTTTCRTYEPIFFKGLGLSLIVSGVFSALSFVWLATDLCFTYYCEYSIGADMTTGACILFFCSGVCAMFVRPSHPVYNYDVGQPFSAPGTVTIVETVMPDGTRLIRKTTVNADASTSVEEMTIQVSGAQSSINNTIDPVAGPPEEALNHDKVFGT